MHPDLHDEIARTMETEPRLLPLLPELLADVPEIGASVAQILGLLREVGLPAGSRVLDLGAGKGAVAVALAAELGFRVDGIEAFPPFMEAGRALASRRGVADRCRMEAGDLRQHLGRPETYDAVLLLSVGPVLGDHRRTVGGLRTLVRPGGLLVLEDGFLAQGIDALEHCEGYAGRDETVRQLTAHGDELLREQIIPAGVMREINEKNTALIRARARGLMARHPDRADALAAYVARQEEETRRLGTDLICATWVLRRRRPS